MSEYVFDIECNGLKPTLIHCLAMQKVGGGSNETSNYEHMKKFLTREDVVLIGHNIIRFDVPNLERLLGITVRARLVDTLALSWYLEPLRPKHGLADWGVELGIAKPPVEDWDDQPIEVYLERCREDVKINSLLWAKQWKHLLRLYGDAGEAWRLIDYLSFKMKCAALQEKHRWLLDVPRCTSVLEKLKADKEEKLKELVLAMPKIVETKTETKPVKMFLKGKLNALSVAGKKWLTLLEEHNLPKDYAGEVEVVKSIEDPNPSSHIQIKDWLYGLGWIPTTFQYKRDKATGDVRKIPQVQRDKAEGPGLCASVKLLYAVEPKLEVLDGLSIISHRISVLQGFLSAVDEEGYVRAEVQGLTNTLRFKHSVVVNLPGVDKLYGADIRGCLIAPVGYELCGSDMSSLEDRTKQHYMWDYDPDYVTEMQEEGFDPHTALAVFAGEITKKDEEDFKHEELIAYAKVKPIRKVYKGVNYACVYGAGPPTVARTAGCSVQKAEKLVEAYWKRNWSVRKIAEDQVVKVCLGQKWLYNPVSRLWYSLRYEKDRFSTLNQGTGVWCFDKYLGHMMDGGPPIIGQFHDEWIALVRQGNRERVVSHAKSAIKLTNEELMLNRELGMDIQFGLDYAQIH